jgi:hypothetical protein
MEEGFTVVGDRLGEAGAAEAELRTEALAEVRARAGQYLQEPAESVWLDLVQALTRAHGDSEAYDLLRAIEIHARVARRP